MRVPFNPLVQLTGTGSQMGDRLVGNEELESLIHGYDAARSGPFAAWVDQVTHIHERRYAPKTARTSDLALPAARRALEAAGIGAKDLGMIFYASFTQSQVIPGDHCILAHELGADHCPAFNISAACAGSLYGMGLAYGMLASGVIRHALIVGSETISQMLNWHDPLTAILFGDGAGAAVLSRVEGAPEGTGMLPPFLSFEYSPDTIRVRNANNPHEVKCFPANSDNPGIPLVEQAVVEMAGGARVLRNAVNHMSECAARVLGYGATDLKHEEPDLMRLIRSARIVPHQANGRIVDALIERLGVLPERVIRTIYGYGNLSAASNMVALDFGVRHGTMDRVMGEGEKVLGLRTAPHRIEKGDLVLLPSIGGGYLMGCIGLRMGYDGAE